MTPTDVWIDHDHKVRDIFLKGGITLHSVRRTLSQIPGVKIERSEEDVVNVNCRTKKDAEMVCARLTGHFRDSGADVNPFTGTRRREIAFNPLPLSILEH